MYFVKAAAAAVVVSIILTGFSPVRAQLPYNWWDPSGGTFQDPTKWDLGMVPGPLDEAYFSQGSFYTVDFTADAQNSVLYIYDEQITYALNGYTYTTTETAFPSFNLIPTTWAQVTVSDGTLAGTGGLIEGAANAELYILNDGQVLFSDGLVLGESQAGSVLTEGQLRVDGRLTVGDQGNGDLFVEGTFGSGQVDNSLGSIWIAAQPGSAGSVSLDGSNASLISGQINVGGNDVSAGGSGALYVGNGATLYAPGAITIWGPNATLDLDGGTITTGFLDLRPGGIFNWTTGTLEFEADGLIVDSTGLFGDNVTIGASQSLILGEFMGLDVAGVDTGNLTIQNGGTLDVRQGHIQIGGFGPGPADGTLTVTGAGSRLTSTEGLGLFIGTPSGSGGGGTLTIGPGALVEGGAGHATVEDQGTLTLSGGTLAVDGLDIQPGGTFSSIDPASTLRFNQAPDFAVIQNFNGNLHLGQAPGWSPADLSLSFQTLNPVGDLEIGYSSNATLDLDESYATSVNGVVGSQVGGVGDVTIHTNSSWSLAGDLTVGGAGAGTMQVDSSNVDAANILLARDAGSTGDVEVDNLGNFYTDGTLEVGRVGDATLMLRGDSDLYDTRAIIAADEGSTSTVTIMDTGTLWENNGSLFVGGDPSFNDNGGNGTLNILAGGRVTTLGGRIGVEPGSTGVVNVNGANAEWINCCSNVDENEWLVVGVQGAGELHISNGGRVESMVVTAGANLIDAASTADGIITVDGAGSELDALGLFLVGGIGSGDVTASNGATINNQEIQVLGLGQLRIESAASMTTSANAFVGQLGQSGPGPAQVTVTGAGSDWIVQGSLNLGGTIDATLLVENNAQVNTQAVTIHDRGHLRIESAARVNTSGAVKIGLFSLDPAQATINGPGSQWNFTGTMDIGDAAEGTLTVENDADFTAGITHLGLNGGTGRITVQDFGQLDFADLLSIGTDGTGELHVLTNGRAVVQAAPTEFRIGTSATGTGLIEVDGPGADLDTTAIVTHIGHDGGTGSLNIRNGGTVTSGEVRIGVLNNADGSALVEDAGSLWDVSAAVLFIGDTATGSLQIRNSGEVSAGLGLIGTQAGSQGSALVTGNGSLWTPEFGLLVGDYGQGDLLVTDGGRIHSDLLGIADEVGSIGQAQIYGLSSTIQIDQEVFVGGSAFGPGGTGTLIVGNGPGTGGTINIDNTLRISNTGTVQLNGGVINTARLNTVEGTWTWGGGELNLTDPAAGFVVGATGQFGATLTIPAGNRMTVAGPTTVEASAVLDATDFEANNTVINDGTIRSSGHVILGDPTVYQAYSGSGMLDINTNQVTLNTLGFLELDFNMNLDGGTLIVPNGVLLRTTRPLEVHGSIEGPFAQQLGTQIVAIGDLELGDATRPDGFVSNGILDVGDHTVTLHDANQAVLGPMTLLGRLSAPGNLNASAAAVIDIGGNVAGFGEIDSPDTPLIPLINNGDISGNSLVEPITLTGYVKGVGTFNNVTFNGTFAPGFSPATVYLGNARYAGTLEIELGGLAEGDSDLLHHNGDLILGGTLDVALWDGFVPMPGSTIDIMTYNGSLSGAFTGVSNSTGFAGLILGYSTDADSVMITISYLDGDLNLDGFVGIDDLNIVLSNWNQTIPPGNPWADPSGDGFVGIDDLNTVLGNWNAGTPPSGAVNIPEPSTLILLSICGLSGVGRRKIL